MATAAAAAKTACILWFRKGLRVHDNAALHEALAAPPAALYPVFVLDPWFAKPDQVCANRFGFLLESLRDLDASLRKLGSRLYVVRGSAGEAIPRLIGEWGAGKLVFERDTEPYAVRRDAEVTAKAKAKGATVHAVHGHTLYDPDA